MEKPIPAWQNLLQKALGETTQIMVPVTPFSDLSWLSKYPLLEREPLSDYRKIAGAPAAKIAIEECLQDLELRLDTILTAKEENNSAVMASEIRVIHSLADTFGMRRLGEITRLTSSALQLGSEKNLPILANELVDTTKLSIGALEGFSNQKSNHLGT